MLNGHPSSGDRRRRGMQVLPNTTHYGLATHQHLLDSGRAGDRDQGQFAYGSYYVDRDDGVLSDITYQR